MALEARGGLLWAQPAPVPAASAVPLAASAAPTPPRERRNGLHADLGLHVFGLGYERVLHPRVAVQLAGEYYSPWTVNRNVLGLGGSGWAAERDTWGLGARARLFVFFTHRAPQGLFATAYIQLMHLWASEGASSGTGVGWAVGATVGYSLLLFDALALRLGLGAQYHEAVVRAGGRDQGFRGPFPQIDIQLGWVF